jgi:hypothetical protein
VTTFPNWNALFKTGDVCECEHCRSVLGPAAYFADLLLFLRDRRWCKQPKRANTKQCDQHHRNTLYMYEFAHIYEHSGRAGSATRGQ